VLFLKKYPHIYKIKAKNGQIIPFASNQTQKLVQDKIDKDLETKGKSRLIIVKARQRGITTYFQLLGLSYAMSEKGINCYTMAHDSSTARDIFDQKVRFAFDNLPPKLKSLYKIKKDNVRQLMFDEEMQKATLTVGTSARGTTQNVVHISEAGKMSQKKQVWDEMISGTLVAGEQAKIVVIESSPDGGLSSFYEMVQQSLKGESEFDVLFIGWTDAKEYSKKPPENDAWKNKYRILAKTLNLYENPVKKFGINDSQWFWYYTQAVQLKQDVKVQYPFDLEEAFVSQSQSKFDLNIVKNIQPKPPTQTLNGVKIYQNPQEGQIYSLGVDGSSGQGQDYTALTIRKYYKNNEGVHELVAQMKAKLAERETARVVVNLANWYNKLGRTLIVPEVNGLGIAIVDYILDNYNNDWVFRRFDVDPTKVKDVRRASYGYATTNITRPKMVNDFAYAFADGIVEVLNEDEVQEMKNFIYNDNKNRYEAQEGTHDDLLFSDMLCYQGFDYITKYR